MFVPFTSYFGLPLKDLWVCSFFSLPFDVLFFEGKPHFFDIFLQYLPFSFVLIAVGAFVYRLSLHFFSQVFFGAA